jgi:zinc/manganese transport system substrate-binding protein
MKLAKLALLSLCLAAAGRMTPAEAALSVFACEPEWGALATELGGNKVDVYVATTAKQDPHQIQARPSLIARVRSADLVACTGAELEVGWMPVVFRQSGNAKVQPGGPGYFAAADYVRLLEVPNRLDRADGDVHAAGNPHIQTSPKNIRLVAVALGKKLATLDPPNAAFYAERQKAFLQKWDEASAKRDAKAASLKGVNIVAQHRFWIYMMDWLGMKEGLTIEPKPGVPPGSAHIAELIESIPKQGAKMILFTSYEDPRAADTVGERTKIPAVMLPATVGGSAAAIDLIALYDDIVNRLLAGLGGHAGARS